MYLFELQFCLDICPVAGLLDHINFLRNHHTVFHSGCTSLCPNSVGVFPFAHTRRGQIFHSLLQIALQADSTVWATREASLNTFRKHYWIPITYQAGTSWYSTKQDRCSSRAHGVYVLMGWDRINKLINLISHSDECCEGNNQEARQSNGFGKQFRKHGLGRLFWDEDC